MENKMKPLYLSIAGFNIAIFFHPTEDPFLIEKYTRERIKNFYPGFVSKGEVKKIDFFIDYFYKTSFEVVLKQKQKNFYVNFYKETKSDRFETYYHISDNQFQIILRAVIQKLLSRNRGLIFHASASLINNKACIFLGASSAGKSTTVNLVDPKFKPLADDSIIIKFEQNRPFFYQTPFIEKNFHIEKYSKRYDLGGFFFLKKSKKLVLERISDKEKALKLLFKQLLTDRPALKAQTPILMRLIDKFKNFYILKFNLDSRLEMIELLDNHEKK